VIIDCIDFFYEGFNLAFKEIDIIPIEGRIRLKINNLLFMVFFNYSSIKTDTRSHNSSTKPKEKSV